MVSDEKGNVSLPIVASDQKMRIVLDGGDQRRILSFRLENLFRLAQMMFKGDVNSFLFG